jgi:hypothetical protein
VRESTIYKKWGQASQVMILVEHLDLDSSSYHVISGLVVVTRIAFQMSIS